MLRLLPTFSVVECIDNLFKEWLKFFSSTSILSSFTCVEQFLCLANFETVLIGLYFGFKAGFQQKYCST